jgi:hypothetical protein
MDHWVLVARLAAGTRRGIQERETAHTYTENQPNVRQIKSVGKDLSMLLLDFRGVPQGVLRITSFMLSKNTQHQSGGLAQTAFNILERPPVRSSSLCLPETC